jgi:O-antigen ligase
VANSSNRRGRAQGQGSRGQSRPPAGRGKQTGKARQGQPPAARKPAADVLDTTMYYILHVMVFVIPMLFAQISYDQFDLIKVVSLRAVTLVLIVLYAWRAFMRREVPVRRSPIDLVILAFLAWVFLSSILSVHVPTAIFGKYRRYEGLISLVNYAVLFYLTTQIVTSMKQVRSLVRTALIAAGVISLYGVMQALGVDFLKWGSLPFDANRAFSSFGNPDLLAGYVSLMLPIGLMGFVSQESSLEDELLAIGLTGLIAVTAVLAFVGLNFHWAPIVLQLLRAVVVLVSIIALVLPYALRFFDPNKRDGHYVTLYASSALLIGLAALTAFSRSAWVASGVALIALGVLFWRQGLYKNRKVLTMALIVVLAVGAVGVATANASSPVLSLGSRIQSIFHFNEGSAASRFSIWRSAWAAAKAKPVFGFGPDTFRLIFPKYKEVAYVKMVGRLSVADNVHNYPLQLAATLGFPGAFLFYGVMLSAIFFGWRSAWVRDERGHDRAMMGGVVVALIAYQVHLFFGISITGSTFLFWVMMAVALLPLAKSRVTKWRPSSQVFRTAIVGVTAIAAAVLFILNIQYFRGDQVYLQSFQYEYYNIDAAIAASKEAVKLDPYNDMYWGQIGLLISEKARASNQMSDIQDSIVWINRAIAFNPYEYDNYVFLANAYTLAANKESRYWQDVIRSARRALAVEPAAPAAYFYEAMAYLEMNQPQIAVGMLKTAVDMDVAYGEAQFYLGQAYERLGNKAEALKAYEAALPTFPSAQTVQQQIDRLKSSVATK